MKIEEIKEIVKVNTSRSKCCTSIWGYVNKSSTTKFDKIVEENNIDITHFGRKKLYEVVEKICPVCESKFETKKGHKREKVTCSHACSNTHFRSGTENGNWKQDSYRTTCFAVHKKECVVCREDKIVEVHHYDENNKNNAVENLVPLCPNHHQYYHSGFRHLVKKQIDEYVVNFKLNMCE